ncbi:MAG TPA: sigma-70 family RNA polymerase sigma factor [Acidobacteriota bacterium]
MAERARSDREAVCAVRAGDRERFEEIVARYQSMLASLAYRMGIARGDLEDVVSEVFLRLYQRLGAYDPSRPFFPWLYSVALHRIRDLQRRAARQAWRPDVGPPAVEPRGPDLVEQDQLRLALAQLPERYRRPLVLYHLEELSVAETAAALDLPEGSVKVQLLRGRRRLRELMERK